MLVASLLEASGNGHLPCTLPIAPPVHPLNKRPSAYHRFFLEPSSVAVVWHCVPRPTCLETGRPSSSLGG